MYRVLVWLVAVLSAVATAAVLPVGDDFDDDMVDSTKWGPPGGEGNGTLTEVNQRLEFSVGVATASDEASWPWIFAVGPYDASWEVQLDVFDDTAPSQNDQVSSFGIDVFNTRDFDDEFFAEIYASHLFVPPLRRGFHAELLVDGVIVGPGSDSHALDVTSGAVRVSFDPTTKVLTAFYDVDPSDGYSWVQLASYGVAGSGGGDGNGDFGMTEGDLFVVSVYGFATAMTVTGGQMYGDNFLTTGLIPVPHTTTTTTPTSTTSTTTGPPTTTTTLPPCPPTPRTGCRRATAGKGALTIKDKPGGSKDVLVWKWRKGAATTKADFGDPGATTTLRLCAWDGSGLRLDAVAPPGGTCGRKPCWKTIKRGYRFRDKSRSPDGILRLVLKEGVDAKAAIVLVAKGSNLEPPAPPLGLPVTVQLVRDEGATCWESTFAEARKNVPGRFKARSSQ